MRLPNGYGSVHKLSGKRRKPWRVRITLQRCLVDGKAKQIYENCIPFIIGSFTHLVYYQSIVEILINNCITVFFLSNF